VVKPVTRRKFGRVVGTTAGIAGVSGISIRLRLTTERRSGRTTGNVEVRYDRVIEDGKVYTIALARNKDTDEINSAIFVRPTGSTGSEELNSEQSEMELLDVSDDVVDDVESTVFDNQDEQKSQHGGTTKIEWGEQTDIWGPIREKTQSSGISTQQKSIIQDVLEEIAAGTKDSVKESWVLLHR